MHPLILSPLHRLTLTLTLAATLAACVPVVMPDPAPSPLADLSQCGGNALHVLVGHPATTLPDKGGWGTLRIIKPGMMVALDYSPTRLNVRVDDADRILALDCG